MQSKEQDNLIIARFFPEEDIYEQLKAVCKKHNVKTAVLLSGIGQMAEFELGFFKEKGDYMPQKFMQPAELLSLSGTILQSSEVKPQRIDDVGEYEFHLHSVLSFPDKSVVGGHLIGAKVSVTSEIVLLKTNIDFYRQIELTTGLKGMFLE